MAKKIKICQECHRELVEISLINLWHFGHNFGARNARKYIKPSKAVVLKREPLESLREEFLIFGKKFAPGKNWGVKAVEKKKFLFLLV